MRYYGSHVECSDRPVAIITTYSATSMCTVEYGVGSVGSVGRTDQPAETGTCSATLCWCALNRLLTNAQNNCPLFLHRSITGGASPIPVGLQRALSGIAALDRPVTLHVNAIHNATAPQRTTQHSTTQHNTAQHNTTHARGTGLRSVSSVRL